MWILYSKTGKGRDKICGGSLNLDVYVFRCCQTFTTAAVFSRREWKHIDLHNPFPRGQWSCCLSDWSRSRFFCLQGKSLFANLFFSRGKRFKFGGSAEFGVKCNPTIQEMEYESAWQLSAVSDGSYIPMVLLEHRINILSYIKLYSVTKASS